MAELDFTIEFNSPLSDNAEAALFDEADARLRELAEGHSDMTGAAVNIRAPGKGEHSFLYEATAVVYSRPEHLAATEKNEDPMFALKGALSAVERQVRERREKLRERWEQPGKGRVVQEMHEVIAAEEEEEAPPE